MRRPRPVHLWRLLEPSARRLEALVFGLRHGLPARRLTVIGVTGTDGKTTTCAFIASILEAAGVPAGVSSTTSFQRPGERRPSGLARTTPNPRILQRRLAEMARAGATGAVLEVTSHGLALNRVSGIRFDVAVLTNVSPEHLEFHKSTRAYVASKTKLFQRCPTLAVLNGDEPLVGEFDRFDARSKLYYGLSAGCDVRAVDVDTRTARAAFTLETPGDAREVRLSLAGRMNVSNALAAAAVGHGLGIEIATIVTGLEQAKAPPGRIERVSLDAQFEVFVDDAHTPAALAELHAALRPLTRGRLIAVLGVHGDRDASKRPAMGEVVGRLCDRVILTEQEGKRDSPAETVRGLSEGVERAGMKLGRDYEVALDRRAAISRSLELAQPGDVITLTSHAHRKTRTTGRGRFPWSDAQVVRELMERPAKVQGAGESQGSGFGSS